MAAASRGRVGRPKLPGSLKSQCHQKCFARLCFCFETTFCVWLVRLPDFSQILPCKLAFQRADMYNSNL